MSDHDASPKEWTHAHSLRHGPQRWLSKLQRKQIKQQQAYIAAITASAAAAHPHFVSPPPTIASAAAASSSSRRRSSLEHVDAAISDANASTLTPSPIVDSQDDVEAVPAAIAEGDAEESEEESAEEDAERAHRSRAPRLRHSVASTDVTHILPDGSFAFRDNFRRQSSAPLMRSASDVDDSWAPSELQQCCCCPACEIAAAHQLAAQQFYMQSLQHVHSSIVSPAHPALDRSATFSAGSAFSPHARVYSTHARAQSAQLLSPATHIAPSFDEAALRLHAASHAASSAPAQPSSAFTSPSAAPHQRSSSSLQPDSKKSLLSLQTGVAQPVVAAAAVVAEAPAAVSVVPTPPSVAPISPPPAAASSHTALLPRWFLIILAILRETDGRDKLAKCVQYGSRTFAILLRQLPAAIWWIGFASKHLREGRFAPIGRAINILLSNAPTAAAAAAATAVAVAEPALQVASAASGSASSAASVVVARSSFSAALRSSYLADTSLFRARLETNPFYNGALSRIAVLSAALSSGRRVIRLLKWTYTLPTWAKTFASWKAQVRASLEKDALVQAHEEEEQRRKKEEEEEEGQKQQQQQGGHAAKERSDSTVSSSSTSARQPAPESQSESHAQSGHNFRFSHPHPPHLWRRLPWLSSVELLDLSIAVATDVSDDLEWLSKYRLFPSEWGYRCGRLAMCLWFSTVILDLLLTFRILRHYHYQQGQLQRQIGEAQMEFATLARQLNLRQQERQDRDLRRAQRRQLQHSPLFKRIRESNSERLSQVPADQQTSAAPVVANANLAASGVSDASWSVLLSDNGSAHTNSSGSSEGSSTRSSQSQPTGDASDSRASSVSEQDDADAAINGGENAPSVAEAEHKDDDDAQSHADDGADCVHSDDELESAEDAAAGELLQSSSVEAYRRVSELRSQAGAIRVSLFLQYLNFAKFAFDLGCAAPMAWNVQKEHDSMVQATGLVSGLLGVYKLFITAKPAQ